MVILEKNGVFYISLLYPIGGNSRLSSAFNWALYSKGIYGFAAASVLQLIFAIFLTEPSFYTETRFNIFSGIYLFFAIIRFFKNSKNPKISIKKCKPVRLAPLIVWIDIISFLKGIGVMLLIVSNQMSVDKIFSINNSDIISIFGYSGIFIMLLAALFILNGIAFLLGFGRNKYLH